LCPTVRNTKRSRHLLFGDFAKCNGICENPDLLGTTDFVFNKKPFEATGKKWTYQHLPDEAAEKEAEFAAERDALGIPYPYKAP